MRIEHIAIAVPAEAPQTPEGWQFHGYAVVNEEWEVKWPTEEWHDAKNLEEAAGRYVDYGKEYHLLVARYEYEDPDRFYQIYCQFGPNITPGEGLYKWGEWLNWDDSRLFDISIVNAPVAA